LGIADKVELLCTLHSKPFQHCDINVFTQQIIISVHQTLMCPVQLQSLFFSWTFLIANSKAKLKNDSDKTSPCQLPTIVETIAADARMPLGRVILRHDVITNKKQR
jgi:hypothetical protein